MSKKYINILLCITLLAIALRLIVCMELQNTPAVRNPLTVTDMATYRHLALAIRHGQWPAFFDYQPLYYTVFLPVAYILSPDGGVWGPMVLQILAGGLTVWLTGLSGAQLLGRKAGLLAALLLALSRYHIFYTPYLLLEVLFGLGAATVLYLTIRILRQKQLSPIRCAFLGLALSLTALTRGSALLWSPVLIAVILWRFRNNNWRRIACGALAALLCYTLVQLPYIIRNSSAMGRFCGASVAGGKVLVLGNSPEAPAAGLEYPRTYHQWVEDESQGRCSVLKNILRWARQEPLAFGELCVRKLVFFWEHNEIPNNISFSPHADNSRVLHWPIMLPWGILGTLALAYIIYMAAFLRHHSTHVAFGGLMLAFWVATSAFYLLARFRVGFIPLQCIAAAGTIQLLWTKRTKITSSHLTICAFILPLLFSFYVVNLLPEQWRQMILPSYYAVVRPDGLRLKFPNGRNVLYDHAPLCDSAQIFCGIPAEGLRLQKQFRLEASCQPSSVRVRQRVIANQLGFSQRGIQLVVNGRSVVSACTLINERFAQWLCWEVPQVETPGSQLDIQLFIPAGSGIEAVILDPARDYGRTVLGGQSVPAEAVMEIEFN